MQVPRVVLALLFPTALAAQATDTTRLPRELASALFDSFIGDGPAFVVGRVPASEAEALLPPGLRVVGGTRYSPRKAGYHGSYTVAAVAQPRRETFALGREHLLRNGWREAHRELEIDEGFVSSGSRAGVVTDFCKDSSYIQLGTRTNPEGGSFLLIRHAPSSENSACRNPRPTTQGMEPISPLPLPMLLPPDDAQGVSFGNRGGEGTAFSSAHVHSRLSNVQLVQHYADQMKKEGWTMTRRIAEGPVVTQWMKRRFKGADIIAMLTNHRMPENSHNISVTIYGVLPAGQ